MRLFLILALFMICALPHEAVAETPPTPESKQESLEHRVKEISGELDKTKDRLVKIGRSIQNNEKTLQELEGRIQELETKRETIHAELQEDQKSISRLVLALQRIKRVPPEALIAKPDAPLKTAQSAMLMSDIIPTLNKQAERLKTNLQSLDEISTELETKKQAAIKSSAMLKEEEVKLSELVDRRQKLYAKTASDLEEQQKRARKISHQAKNVRDLVKRLEDDKQQSTSASPSTQQAVLTTPIPKPGKPQLPLSGIIRTGYNQTDAFGAPSKGLEIEGRAGALIVVPMGGIVRFAGHFKNYGNMIIIEHEKGYHSLIAGFEKLDTVVGQSVSTGEPLGKLHNTSNASGKNPTLYYELRYKGEPINPAKKFSGLS
ncbi:MAG: peptidoglycan DD-metalloendopeptidase family protein [Alphaproteobacteria bacterium]|nr:peptidoglycan DD-metalloendopeptidase family protein [Alphaproteobacteria bacterium]